MYPDRNRSVIVLAAIERYGSMANLARHLDVSRQVLHAWTVRGVPLRSLVDLSTATGLSKYELRPDIYGGDPKLNPNGMLDREIVDALDDAALRARERHRIIPREIESLIRAAENCVRMLRGREREEK